MTDEQLTEIERALAAARDTGCMDKPWTLEIAWDDHSDSASYVAGGPDGTEECAELIVNSPTWLTALVEEVRRLRRTVTEAKPLIDAVDTWRYTTGEVPGTPAERTAEEALIEAFDAWTSR